VGFGGERKRTDKCAEFLGTTGIFPLLEGVSLAMHIGEYMGTMCDVLW